LPQPLQESILVPQPSPVLIKFGNPILLLMPPKVQDNVKIPVLQDHLTGKEYVLDLVLEVVVVVVVLLLPVLELRT